MYACKRSLGVCFANNNTHTLTRTHQIEIVTRNTHCIKCLINQNIMYTVMCKYNPKITEIHFKFWFVMWFLFICQLTPSILYSFARSSLHSAHSLLLPPSSPRPPPFALRCTLIYLPLFLCSALVSTLSNLFAFHFHPFCNIFSVNLFTTESLN